MRMSARAMRTALAGSSRPARAAVLMLAAAWGSACGGWGLEYCPEWHDTTIGRRRTPLEHNDPAASGTIGGGAFVHRVGLTDKTGALMAGLGGGASQHLERNKAVERLIERGGGTETYTWSMPGVAPGPRTVLSFYWGNSDDSWGANGGLLHQAAASDAFAVWGLDVRWTLGIGLDDADTWILGVVMDVFWKNVTARVETDVPPGKPGGATLDEAMIGFLVDLELTKTLFDHVGVTAYAGWDPFYGLLQMLPDDSSPGHNFEWGGRVTTVLAKRLRVGVDLNQWFASIGTGDRFRKARGTNYRAILGLEF